MMSNFFRFEGWLLVIGAFLLVSGYGLLCLWAGRQGAKALTRGKSLILTGLLGSGTLLVLGHAVLLRDIVMGIGVLLALGIALGVIRSRT